MRNSHSQSEQNSEHSRSDQVVIADSSLVNPPDRSILQLRQRDAPSRVQYEGPNSVVVAVAE